MNVDHIYQLQRDDAFAAQFSSTVYQTFVAMPFSNRGGYPEARIKALLTEKVHERANALRPAPPANRTFAPLRRMDGGPGGAVVITDQIATDILACHFFLGDLTGCNFGVVLETGIALRTQTKWSRAAVYPGRFRVSAFRSKGYQCKRLYRG